ncbi:uncharacterized protein ACRADG_000585 isoform 1-T2 [Cochliomyia hominivorax]
MAHFCGFIKLIFLLLMLARIPSNETRPLKGNSQTNSDLIAGNEFLKLFMDRDHIDHKDLYSNEYNGGGGGGGDASGGEIRSTRASPSTSFAQKEESFDKKSSETGRRSSSGRSLKDKGPKLNQAEGQLEDSKQVVKLVTSGSKIVFLEDYDENDAILDAEARDIDLKKEIFKSKSQTNFDDYKVVAVSVSSSSQRGTTTARNRLVNSPTVKYERKTTTTHKPTSTTINKSFVTMTPRPPTATTTKKSQTSILSVAAAASSTKVDTTAGDNFINRSHKSEFSIEEVEPLTMTQQKSRKIHSRQRTYPVTSVADTLDILDSENSASTNIHNILAAPLQTSASARSASMVTTTYHSGQRNMTINHDSNLHVDQVQHKSAVSTTAATNTNEGKSKTSDLQSQQKNGNDGGVEDQLLPFQTVIYHDTKAGHGPQSRSISYSSISQNVEDLKKWQQSGILAEARRNVSESLKPVPRSNTSSATHQSEPAKFYSQPSKMYSEPSKFYSEPAKVYSEPAKIYGEPEKFYSEPAKVYSQPSKFYSEPSKVYSQPAKVYSEPAKTYWPILTATTSTSTHNPATLIPPTLSPTITTSAPTQHSVNIHPASRKPAIVSRIAFGEAHLTSSSSTTTTSTTTPAPLTTTSRTFGSHSQHHYSRTYSSHRNPSSSSSSSSSSSLHNENSSLSSSFSSSTPSRRILFNLDRLPYDLLNAPEPSIQQQQLLELQKTKRPQQTLTYHQQQQQQQQQKQRHNINPCLESAVSSLFSSSSLSAHPALLKQRQQQHSSLSDQQQQQQHSNQNAKGLPNGDLVKCVAEISHTTAATVVDDENDDTGGGAEAFTTERSHIEELFTPTPEQNYEIEESVSVMTNGRAHGSGINGGGGRNSLAQPTLSPIHQQQHHGFKPNRQRTRIRFGTNVNNPTDVHGENNNNRHHNVPDYEDGNSGNDDSGDDSNAKNNDYNDDGGAAAGNVNNDGTDDEDSKVAYIVEGQNYRKYRVEEETDDGFIVGEYGVVDHNDGNLRGVRYTADSTINRSLIQKALLTFLKLK